MLGRALGHHAGRALETLPGVGVEFDRLYFRFSCHVSTYHNETIMRKNDAFFRELKRAIDAFNEEPYLEYWRELGQFIDAFADAEDRLISLLRKHARVSEKVAGVLFSGTRASEAKDKLYGLLDATGHRELKKRLEHPLGQLAAINTTRNHLIHWVARSDGTEDLLVSNAYLSPSQEKLKEFRIGPKHMRQMRQDLYRINAMLMMEESPPSRRDADLEAYLAGPWLYKSPQPSRQRKKFPKTRKTRKHRDSGR